jgi:hypothetical protein
VKWASDEVGKDKIEIGYDAGIAAARIPPEPAHIT